MYMMYNGTEKIYQSSHVMFEENKKEEGALGFLFTPS